MRETTPGSLKLRMLQRMPLSWAVEAGSASAASSCGRAPDLFDGMPRRIYTNFRLFRSGNYAILKHETKQFR
uniref:Uncharacterized protein n=1 Tax=Arundo donax TaxID=35708 RepID=A0A0A9AKA1_ARUDO